MFQEDFFNYGHHSLVSAPGAGRRHRQRTSAPRHAAGVCTEQWVLEHPETLLELQRAYVEAGAQVLLAPTFGANALRLKAHGLADAVAD